MPSKIFKPHSQFSRLGMEPSACTYIIMYLFFYDVIGVGLIFIFYEFYLFLFFYIDRLLKLRFLTQYILLTYFSKLLRLRFLTLHFAYFLASFPSSCVVYT